MFPLSINLLMRYILLSRLRQMEALGASAPVLVPAALAIVCVSFPYSGGYIPLFLLCVVPAPLVQLFPPLSE